MHKEGRFVVILPTYNRAKTLPQAIESVRAQTDRDWRLYILDDGSIDNTEAVVHPYTIDPRIRYRRFDDNRGGVAMNEIGMELAVAEGTYWVRLGSDDWFEPEKLALDRIALRFADACFGPYENEGNVAGAGNYPRPARQELLAGSFCASWANIAMKTSVLAKVKARFGNFVDPGLRNMEDWLFNVRAARFTEFVWRGLSVDGARVAAGATHTDQIPTYWYRPDAWYRIAADGATYAPQLQKVVQTDMALTERLSGLERAAWPPDEIEPFGFVTILPFGPDA